MVVHDDDFIVAGDGDDLDWLIRKLNEKLHASGQHSFGLF